MAERFLFINRNHHFLKLIVNKKPKVCIVTPDLLGPVKNGGIGTACFNLAIFLVESGFAVSILFTNLEIKNKYNAWCAKYRAAGIDVCCLDSFQSVDSIRTFPYHQPLAISHIVHGWLSDRKFDLVFFMDWQGHGFYSLHSKKSGLRFKDTLFVTLIHSPSVWHAVNNAQPPTDPLSSITYFMERKSIELADVVISPSAYMLDWVRRYGFNPPKKTYILPNLIAPNKNSESGDKSSTHQINELVFFGRLEYRKGLIQFCDSLDRLSDSGLCPLKVSFLGKFSLIGDEHSGAYISRRSIKWKFPIEIHPFFDQEQSIDYLRNGHRLAVMPSVADNSPYTIYECLAFNLPFLSRNVGGVSELIHHQDHQSCLFGDHPQDLAYRLEVVLRKGCVAPRPAFDFKRNSRAWLSLVNQLLLKSKTKVNPNYSSPLVSVCLTHFNRPKLLKQAVDSLINQDYPNFEVILVDDGSTDILAIHQLDKLESVFRDRGWMIFRIQNGFLGKARNFAAKHSKGRYLIFMDDDNVAKPNMISSFVTAATVSKAKLVTSAFDVFTGDKKPTNRSRILERYLPVGGIVSFSALSNAIGDANSLIHRKLFGDLGGFSEDYGLGHEDFELYLRGVLSGVKVCVVPDILFWYRRNPTSMISVTNPAANRMRSFRPFMDLLPAPLYELAFLAQGSFNGRSNHVHSNMLVDEQIVNDDLRKLVKNEPNDASTVLSLARILSYSGQTELSDQILKDLSLFENDSISGYSHHSIVRLLSLVKSGDVGSVRKMIKKFGRSKSSKIEMSDFIGLFFSNFELSDSSPAVLEVLAYQCSSGNPNSVFNQLQAAIVFHYCGRNVDAIDCFERALKLATEDYLKRRPDVCAAVDSGRVESGLVHYLQNGRHEGCDWMHLELFKRVGQSLSGLPQVSQTAFFA